MKMLSAETEKFETFAQVVRYNPVADTYGLQWKCVACDGSHWTESRGIPRECFRRLTETELNRLALELVTEGADE